MIITGMTEEQIRRGVDRIENALVQNITPMSQTRYRVKLTVDSTRDGCSFYRVSFRGDGRKIHALCWHGFRSVMRQWFKICPDARLQTAMATYRGSDEFELFHDATGNRNIGGGFTSMRARDACNC